MVNCENTKKQNEISSAESIEVVKIPSLDLEEANRLAQLPLHCMDVEYPNKLKKLSEERKTYRHLKSFTLPFMDVLTGIQLFMGIGALYRF